MLLRATVTMAVLALLTISCTAAPVDRGPTVQVNYVDDPLGDQYRYAADEITSTWTFNREAEFVLSFEGGSVTYEGELLQPGCYSDTGVPGEALELDGATGFEFLSPATSEACEPIPTG